MTGDNISTLLENTGFEKADINRQQNLHSRQVFKKNDDLIVQFNINACDCISNSPEISACDTLTKHSKTCLDAKEI